jgi:MFS family permease
MGRRGRVRLVAVLSITETISWGIVDYAFAVFLPTISDDLGTSETAVAAALALAVATSAVVGLPVGRYLDRRGPRSLMTAGSVAAVLLLAAWSRVDALWLLYLVWVGLGVAMAAILYEPAFVVLAKWVPDSRGRRRAMTTVTLAAALASFIFVPLAQALLDDHGWRTAVLILAAILAVTVPLHLLLPRGRPPATDDPRPATPGLVREILRRIDFRRMTAGYFLASFAGIAPLVLMIPLLVDRGYSSGFAAFAVGTIGAAQIPGRVVFSLSERWVAPQTLTPVVFSLVAAGLLVVLVAPTAGLVLVGTVVLGIGNGMATLSRATVLADRFGTAVYGTVASVTAATTTGARALAPVAGTGLASAVGAAASLGILAGFAVAATVVVTGLGGERDPLPAGRGVDAPAAG